MHASQNSEYTNPSLKPVTFTTQLYFSITITTISPHGWPNLDKAVKETHLPLEGKQQLLHLLQSNLNSALFSSEDRLTSEKQAVVREQLKEMMGNGIVEPSYSAWASPVVLVPKKDGNYSIHYWFEQLLLAGNNGP